MVRETYEWYLGILYQLFKRPGASVQVRQRGRGRVFPVRRPTWARIGPTLFMISLFLFTGRLGTV
jgi:hypothetical protein